MERLLASLIAGIIVAVVLYLVIVVVILMNQVAPAWLLALFAIIAFTGTFVIDTLTEVTESRETDE
jgi:hypothetical protein